ncbi:hypothetical protein NUW54_g11399 [Trametes sanguinea]|uniref:Uncharacterized protein n=1 Tax=Trametes sanguinea TaxID=158606 RepID=A0ACC1NFL7_9APHY|nr:hypothetical protein NUW54_g11399 [Trametes sanguinea]
MFLSDTERLQYRLEPTPDIIDAAWDTIQDHEHAIDDLEDRIQDLLHQVQNLRYDQAKHRAAIERCKGLITLARRLPEELLIKIFEHCIEDGWTRAPVVVSHVCSAWRKAALAPKVWSHVYVNARSCSRSKSSKPSSPSAFISFSMPSSSTSSSSESSESASLGSEPSSSSTSSSDSSEELSARCCTLLGFSGDLL